MTLFQYFCGELFNGGILSWRIYDGTRQVVIFNDYDSTNGHIKVNTLLQITVEIYQL